MQAPNHSTGDDSCPGDPHEIGDIAYMASNSSHVTHAPESAGFDFEGQIQIPAPIVSMTVSDSNSMPIADNGDCVPHTATPGDVPSIADLAHRVRALSSESQAQLQAAFVGITPTTMTSAAPVPSQYHDQQHLFEILNGNMSLQQINSLISNNGSSPQELGPQQVEFGDSDHFHLTQEHEFTAHHLSAGCTLVEITAKITELKGSSITKCFKCALIGLFLDSYQMILGIPTRIEYCNVMKQFEDENLPSHYLEHLRRNRKRNRQKKSCKKLRTTPRHRQRARKDTFSRTPAELSRRCQVCSRDTSPSSTSSSSSLTTPVRN